MDSFIKKCAGIFSILLFSGATNFAEPPKGENWKLVFEDDFTGDLSAVDENWLFQNGSNGHILCSRWRENASVENGILKLNNRKESRGGQDWTSASLWTKRKFLYGYFECRYKYANATGVNNSFWLITTGKIPDGVVRYEIDINEGHFPCEINTNLHNWSDIRTLPDGKKTHPAYHKAFNMAASRAAPWSSFENSRGVKTSKIRLFRNKTSSYFHLREIRFLGGDEFDPAKIDSLENLASTASVSVSGVFEAKSLYAPQNAVDGRSSTSWVANKIGDKWFELDLGGERVVNAVQVLTGWQNNGEWIAYTNDFQIQYWDASQSKWKPFSQTASYDAFYEPIMAKKFKVLSPKKSDFKVEMFAEGDAKWAKNSGDAIFANMLSCDFKNLLQDARTQVSKDGDNVIFEADFDKTVAVGSIKISGEKKKVKNYSVEYFDEALGKWIPFVRRAEKYPDYSESYAEQYHILGLKWTKEELVFYIDGAEIRRMKNDICHYPSPVYLSAAVAEFAGAVTDKVDGTSMDVDWVRIWEVVEQTPQQ